MSANLEKIYREHIAPLGRADQLKLIEKVAGELAAQNSESENEKNPKHSILELRGLGAEIWQGVDAQEYVNKLRDEWER